MERKQALRVKTLAQRASDGIDVIFLACAAAACIAVTAARIPPVLKYGSRLNFVSGACLAQAADFAEGVFYRPAVSDDGYGGTRYMPLSFVLMGLLMRAGVAPVAAGYAVTFASAAALGAGVYVLTRRLTGNALLAACAGAMWLAFHPAQYAVTTVRADILPAALNVWGLALVAGVAHGQEHGGQRLAIAGAAALFALAFAAKLTTVFGLVAAVAALALSGRRRQGLTLAVAGMGAIALVIAVTVAASHGRWLDAMHGGTGLTIRSLAAGPVRLVRRGVTEDPFSAAAWALCVVALVASPARLGRGLPGLAFVATAGVTAAMFALPGTDFNHFLDLDVAALVLLVVLVATCRAPVRAVALAALVMLAAYWSFGRFRDGDQAPQYADLRAAAADAVGGPGPILSDNALVPLLAGERAFLLDRFMFAARQRIEPSLGDDLVARVEGQRFRAVVLSRPEPGTPGWHKFYDGIFGGGFIPALERNYTLRWQHGPYLVYLPCVDNEGPPDVEAAP